MMALPFFNGRNFMGRGMSPFQNMQQIMQSINAIRQNPSQIGQLLFEQGKITKQQLDEIQQSGISGNPSAIGQYLMQHGSFTQQQAQEVYNNSVQPIQNSMKQN